MAELADAQDLKSCCSDTVPVRFRSPALHNVQYVSVAQLDRALGYGPRCREFESSHSRFKPRKVITFEVFFFILKVMVFMLYSKKQEKSVCSNVSGTGNYI